MDFDSITARQCSFPAAMIPRLAPRLSRLFLAAAAIWLASFPAFARGDRVIPQVADGAGRIRTKVDITNLSSTTAIFWAWGILTGRLREPSVRAYAARPTERADERPTTS